MRPADDRGWTLFARRVLPFRRKGHDAITIAPLHDVHICNLLQNLIRN
jgi:hypothetical protein